MKIRHLRNSRSGGENSLRAPRTWDYGAEGPRTGRATEEHHTGSGCVSPTQSD